MERPDVDGRERLEQTLVVAVVYTVVSSLLDSLSLIEVVLVPVFFLLVSICIDVAWAWLTDRRS